MQSYGIVSYIAEAVDINQTTSIIVLALISGDHAIFTLASSPQKYSEYFPM
jgi:arginine repressor